MPGQNPEKPVGMPVDEWFDKNKDVVDRVNNAPVRDATHYVGDGCQPPHTSITDENNAEEFEDLFDSKEEENTKAGLSYVKNTYPTVGEQGPHWYNNPLTPAMQREVDLKEMGRGTHPRLVLSDSDIDLARALLHNTTGLDVNSEHGQDTPKRFATMLREMTTPEEYKFTTFENTEHIDEMVVVQDMPFYALCNHHVVPFFGMAHVAYVPERRIAGLSKFARAVKNISKGLWVQENLTVAIADFLEEKLAPRGIAVVMKGEHLCMAMRGVGMPGALTTTSCMRGVFADHNRTAKAEFMSMLP